MRSNATQHRNPPQHHTHLSYPVLGVYGPMLYHVPMSTSNPTTTAQHPAAQSPSAAPAPAAKPKRPLGARLLPRPLAVKNAALADSLDRSLSAIPSATPATVSWSAPEVIDAACALIDAAASTLPPQRNAEQDAAGAAPQTTGSSTATPPYDGTIRDAEGFRAWVAERPESRVRVAMYLSECSRTGKLNASMDAAGLTLGIVTCLQQRHPVFRRAMEMLCNTSARGLVRRAREVVEDVMINPDDQQIQLKAASIAMQYGPRASSGEAGDGSESAGGVQIVINMGPPPPVVGVAIPMEQVNGKSLFVQSR